MSEKELNNEEVKDVSEEVAKVKEDGKVIKGIRRILAGIADQIISVGLSLIILVAFDFIIKFAGYYVADRVQMFIVLYIIVNILYTPICDATKLKTTIGKRIILN